MAQKFELTARTREVNLHIDVPGPLPLINADVSMIERVVTNLLDNAMRHTPVGGRSVWRSGRRINSFRSKWQTTERASMPRCATICSSGRRRCLPRHRGGSRWVRVADCETNAGAARGRYQTGGVGKRGAVQVLRATLRNRRVRRSRHPAKKLLREPLVANFLVGTVGLNRFQRGVQFLQQRLVIRAHGNAESGAEVLRVGHFRRGCPSCGLVFSHSLTTAVSPNTPSIRPFSNR